MMEKTVSWHVAFRTICHNEARKRRAKKKKKEHCIHALLSKAGLKITMPQLPPESFNVTFDTHGKGRIQLGKMLPTMSNAPCVGWSCYGLARNVPSNWRMVTVIGCKETKVKEAKFNISSNCFLWCGQWCGCLEWQNWLWMLQAFTTQCRWCCEGRDRLHAVTSCQHLNGWTKGNGSGVRQRWW